MFSSTQFPAKMVIYYSLGKYMDLLLFVKYLVIYHFFEPRFCGNQVFHGTQVHRTRVP